MNCFENYDRYGNFHFKIQNERSIPIGTIIIVLDKNMENKTFLANGHVIDNCYDTTKMLLLFSLTFFDRSES